MRMVKRAKLFGTGILVGVLMITAGCGTETGLTDPGVVYEESLVAIAVDDDDEGLLANWYQVATKAVLPFVEQTVTGSRYTLTLDDKALNVPLIITISERDPDVIDIDLGPDGTVFLSPVTLTIDYKGTKNDPTREDYNKRRAMLFYHNPVTMMWEEVAGVDNPRDKTFTAQLDHFSRYAMWDGASSSTTDGTSGWEVAAPDPLKDKDSIKN